MCLIPEAAVELEEVAATPLAEVVSHRKTLDTGLLELARVLAQ